MRVEITCSNRVGILQKIMAIFGEFRINVASGELGGDSGDKVYLSAPDMLTTQYQTIEKSLYRVVGVTRVRRIALIPSERRHFELDTLLRHIADPVLSVDRDGQVIAANLAAAKAFGVNLDQVSGLQLQRFLPRLQLAELLRGFTVPRYGLIVTVRGREYRLDWSPIALAERPGAVDSLAGAVLTLQRDSLRGEAGNGSSSELLSGAGGLSELDITPKVLWDFDRRRDACLLLQSLAPLGSPLLIVGESGSGKSVFAAAAHNLSPVASKGSCYYLDAARPEWSWPGALPNAGTLILENLHTLEESQQYALTGQLIAVRESSSLRLVATANSEKLLLPALAQVFSTLAIRLPPLRTMRPALPRFASAMLDESLSQAERQRSVQEWIGTQAIEFMQGRDWPENFSGLNDFLTAALTHCRQRGGLPIKTEDLPVVADTPQLPWQAWSRGLNYKQMMERVERTILAELITEQTSTRELAKQLGISHTAVANKLRKYGLNRQ